MTSNRKKHCNLIAEILKKRYVRIALINALMWSHKIRKDNAKYKKNLNEGFFYVLKGVNKDILTYLFSVSNSIEEKKKAKRHYKV